MDEGQKGQLDPVTQPTQPTQPTQLSNVVLIHNEGLDGVLVRLICTKGGIPVVDLKNSDDKKQWIFGRNSTADVHFKDKPPRLSGRHFKIWHSSDGNVLITDLSTNGTFVNSTRLLKGKNYLLNQGDEVAVGIGVEADIVRFIVVFPKPKGDELEPDPTRTEISSDYIIKKEVIGQGAFATVKKAVERASGETYAVKIISKRKLGVDNVNGVKRELDILGQLDHEYIVKLKGSYEDDDCYYLIMDFVSGGDLMDFVAGQGSIDEPILKEITRQILQAIDYVHKLGISHRDLKPDNILIAKDDPIGIKITDFGLAKVGEGQGSQLKTFCGTLAYVAPEIIDGKLASRNKHNRKSYSSLVDMWLIGCLCYVILTAHLPFSGKTQDQLFRQIRNGSYHDSPLNDLNLSENAKQFIDSLLQVDPSRRLTAEEALSHPWMVEGSLPNSAEENASKELVSQVISDLPAGPVVVDLDTTFNAFKSQNNQEIIIENPSVSGPTYAPPGTFLTLLPLNHSIDHDKIFIPRTNRPFIVGRNANCNFSIEDSRISKFHCIIIRKRHPIGKSFYESPAQGLDDIWLIDYSTNGCHINGKKISKGKKTLLRNNDQILLFLDFKNKQFLGFKVQINDKTGLYDQEEKHQEGKFNQSLVESQDDVDSVLIDKILLADKYQKDGNLPVSEGLSQMLQDVKVLQDLLKRLMFEAGPRKRAALNTGQKRPKEGLAFHSQL